MKAHYEKGPSRTSLLIGVLLAVLSSDLRADCTVTAGPVVFGNYNPFALQSLDSAGTINVSCTPSSSYTLSLSTGGGSYAQRQLSGSGDVLYYNLYTSASRTAIWGDGSGGSGTVSGSGEEENHTVYGRIAAQQNVKVGSYGDSIIVTVTF